MAYKIIYTKDSLPFPLMTVKDTLESALKFAKRARKFGGYSVDIWERTEHRLILLLEESDLRVFPCPAPHIRGNDRR